MLGAYTCACMIVAPATCHLMQHADQGSNCPFPDRATLHHSVGRRTELNQLQGTLRTHARPHTGTQFGRLSHRLSHRSETPVTQNQAPPTTHAHRTNQQPPLTHPLLGRGDAGDRAGSSWHTAACCSLCLPSSHRPGSELSQGPVAWPLTHKHGCVCDLACHLSLVQR